MLPFILAKERDKIEDKKIFANKILLHAEVYYHMRLTDGTRLKILAEPLIQYLEDLLQDNPKDNIYFIMIQVGFCVTCMNKKKQNEALLVKHELSRNLLFRFLDLVKIFTRRVRKD